MAETTNGNYSMGHPPTPQRPSTHRDSIETSVGKTVNTIRFMHVNCQISSSKVVKVVYTVITRPL